MGIRWGENGEPTHDSTTTINHAPHGQRLVHLLPQLPDPAAKLGALRGAAVGQDDQPQQREGRGGDEPACVCRRCRWQGRQWMDGGREGGRHHR